MATLLFFDQGHKYTLDGEELPSVSELCRFLSREIYGDVAQWRLDQAADRGTAVHKATEALDKYGKVDVQDGILPYLQAYLSFRREHPVEWQKIEYATHHPDRRYAGTIDRYGLVDGAASLVDIKTSYTIHKPLCAAQLNLYRWILEAEGRPVDRLYILHLKKDGAYKLQQFEKDDALPEALLTLHEALKKKRRKKNV
uniref:Exonuclease n=1 Tax=Siphoviridae sp. ctvok7 TaxID=2827596 RepID=A0A8S5LM42_9CAUD|nr:MAG TPA: exonuclease [Siphoviridae sp. ctvok7]